MSASPITLRAAIPAGNAAPITRASAAAPPPPELARDRVAVAPHRAEAGLREAARHQSAGATGGPSPRHAQLVQALLAHVPAGDRPAATIAIPAILDAAQRTGTSDPNRLAYFLATAQTESDFGANMTEAGHSRQWFTANYAHVDGNRPGTSDGFTYRGRGYVQTTGAGRYAEMSRELHLPRVRTEVGGHASMQSALVAHPEQLTDPAIAARALVVGIMRNAYTHNPAAALDVTIPTGKPPGEVDFYHARGIVNGIVHSQAQAIARHATLYARILDGYRDSVLAASR